ncbi:hypothetical protein DL89DRAFT_295102 [Linderina pennispora]|uniref:Uncharacterized protein n=1 Tax=Linderina pennispora TaxID=61395 RepID=A0A1Y1VZN9_9FUNG|nr:uncharacterized protein DL89DRAFT_295102 [Linderina pennispora]ORX66712.1 hypothetical protein DL89DRAFT_295102 [Linderina pennispora]
MNQVQHYQELIQQAARLALERSVAESDEPSVDAIEPAAKAIREALSPKGETVKRDFDQHLSFRSQIETMDSVSIEVAQELFGFLETRTALVRKVMAETTGKGVAMLKICNSLLRRIPHATMGEFAGSVQIFIANSFPLSERSGVNVRGDFDTSNIPAIDTAGLDEGGREEKLYRSFWSLQECFANPQSVFKNRPESFDSFVKAAKLALEEFRKVEHKNQPQATATAAMHDTAPLNSGDPQFKCQILVQLLIFTKLKEAAVNKLVVVNMEITDAEEQTLRDLSERAGNQLLTMPRDRGTFRRAAVFMLMHEADWARWKAGSCKPFEGVPMPELVDEMQSAAQSFFEVRDEVWATDVESLEGIGNEAQSVTLKDTLGKLTSFLTLKERGVVDLLQWRALRMSIPSGDIRDVDPTSKTLGLNCENGQDPKEDQVSTTDVDDEPFVTEVK